MIAQLIRAVLASLRSRGWAPGTTGSGLALALTVVVLALAAAVPASEGAGAVPGRFAVASPSASPVASPVAGAEASSTLIVVGEVTIVMTDSGFQPSYFESAAGRDITITVVNMDDAVHTFTIGKLDIDVEVMPGERARIEIDRPRLGHYEYTSSLANDEAFTGAFSVFI